MTHTIPSEERALAAWTHLSGLAGYIVPLGGVLVPVIIWIAKKDAPVIVALAKQALLLNVSVYLVVALTAVLWLTIILIPLVVLLWIALGLVAIALPIVGGIRALDGTYYRYPVVGVEPR